MRGDLSGRTGVIPDLLSASGSTNRFLLILDINFHQNEYVAPIFLEPVKKNGLFNVDLTLSGFTGFRPDFCRSLL